MSAFWKVLLSAAMLVYGTELLLVVSSAVQMVYLTVATTDETLAGRMEVP
jgi:hypothetical protein